VAGVARLKRYPALESLAGTDERDLPCAAAKQEVDLAEHEGRRSLAVHDSLDHCSKHSPKGARLGQRTGALGCLPPPAENLLGLGPAEPAGLLEPADQVGKVPEKIDTSPPLDDFGVHEIEATVSGDHRELPAGSPPWRDGGHGPHITLENPLDRLTGRAPGCPRN
jgi:hypothetical protein